MTDRFVTRLKQETAAWVREGIITDEQRARIEARHAVGEGRARAVFIGILSLAGGALIVGGIALVIAHNWEGLSDWTKIGGLVALMAGAYAGGFVLRERGHGGSGGALVMAGGALFLCGIALVGQIYHLNARPPNAVLLWIAALFPIAYLLRSSPVLFLALGGFVVWIGMEAASPDSLIHMAADERSDIYPAVLTLFVPIGIGLAVAGALHGGSRTGFMRLFESLGVLLTGGAIYALGFLRHMHDWADGSARLRAIVLGPVAYVALIVLALISVSWRRYPAEPPRVRWMHVAMMTVLLALGLAPGTLGRIGLPEHDTAIALTLAYWIALLVFSLHLISAGVRWERPGWISLGIVLLGLNIVTRYFDVLGNRLDQGLLYIMGGILILAVSFILERQRRKLLRRLGTEAAP